ncbi:hypothetical protein GCM10007073_19510 [Micrococcus flavus]|nr:hypothetical protein GCM10007073_19510 [Micrococcus flavus]
MNCGGCSSAVKARMGTSSWERAVRGTSDDGAAAAEEEGVAGAGSGAAGASDEPGPEEAAAGDEAAVVGADVADAAGDETAVRPSSAGAEQAVSTSARPVVSASRRPVREDPGTGRAGRARCGMVSFRCQVCEVCGSCASYRGGSEEADVLGARPIRRDGWARIPGGPLSSHCTPAGASGVGAVRADRGEMVHSPLDSDPWNTSSRSSPWW